MRFDRPSLWTKMETVRQRLGWPHGDDVRSVRQYLMLLGSDNSPVKLVVF